MLQFGQGLAAQRPVEAEEGEEGDERQAGAIGVAARLGGHAQRQELEGKVACQSGAPKNPAGAGTGWHGQRQPQRAALQELASAPPAQLAGQR